MKIKYSLFLLATLITFPMTNSAYAADNSESVNAQNKLTFTQKAEVAKKLKKYFKKKEIHALNDIEDLYYLLHENKLSLYGRLHLRYVYDIQRELEELGLSSDDMSPDDFYPDGLSPDEIQESLSHIFTLNWLTQLIMMSNELTSLPETIGNLTHLKRLFLEENKLESLPQAIGDLINLEVLFLNNNQLKTIPASIKKLLNLTILDLRNNPNLLERSDNPLELGKEELRTHFGDRVRLDN